MHGALRGKTSSAKVNGTCREWFGEAVHLSPEVIVIASLRSQ
jgi:hypothetical protein